MAKNVYQSMSTDGFIEDHLLIATRLLGDYLGTDHSQTSRFRNYIKSLHYTVQQNPNDMAGLCSAITNDLVALYGVYLDGVIVDVTATGQDGIPDNPLQEISISVDFTDNSGKTVNLTRALLKNESTISPIGELVIR